MDYEKILDYFNQDNLAADTWKNKYYQEGDTTPDDMHKRMAKEFARIENKYLRIKEDPNTNMSDYYKSREKLTEEKIYNMFKDFKYIVPQGSIMSVLGSKFVGSLSNCFVVGQPVDSYGGILMKDEELVHLMRRRGGVGIDISTLRPKSVSVSGAAKTSTGAVSFMHRYSNTTREVAQDGRRGALMISIDINHPDVMDFIKIKRDGTSVTGANISIKINNDFMKAVENDEDYILRFPCTEDISGYTDTPYNELVQIYDKLDVGPVYIKRIKAKEYWEEIIKSAHGYAEPGIIFVDNHHDYSPDGVYPQFKGVTTNPCGEIFMQEYDACRLIALNLFSFVDNPFTKEAKFNFEKFYQYNYEAMRLSDDLIDLEAEHIDFILNKTNNDPEPFYIKSREIELWKKIKATALSSRRAGLGFTALGDTIASLGMKYDSNDSIDVVDEIMKTKLKSELDCVIDMAKERGPFKGWNDEIEWGNGGGIKGTNSFYKFLQHNYPDQVLRMTEYGRRNVSWNTVAPTGTVSIMTQTTSGIEPIFMPFYIRRKKINPNDKNSRIDFIDENGDNWTEFPVLHPKFRDWIKVQIEKNPDDWGGFRIDIKEDLQQAFEQSPWYGSTANDIDWSQRVKLQGVIQKYITHSISSTINLPSDVSVEEVSKIYLESWKKGLKGITVYRDGSRSGVLISKSDNKNRDEFDYIDAIKRPKEIEAEVHTTRVGGKPHNVYVGLLNGKPYETFIEEGDLSNSKGKIVKSKKGLYHYITDNKEPIPILSQMTDEQSAITRLVSTSLRHGADIKFIVEQLNKTDGDLFSFTKGLARVLKKYIPDGSKSTVTCLDCGGSNVIFEEGCNKCKDCGSSACG